MLERLPKLNPPLEDLIEVPLPGTVTSVSSGAGAVVPIEWLREINTNGVRPGELTPLINGLEDQAEEEDMVSAWPDDTGLPNTIKILPGNPAHGPRIKVALNPPDRFADGSDWAWILFGEAPGSFEPPRPGRAGGPLPSAALLRQLQQFIELNRAALFAFDRSPDQGGISGVQLVQRLRKIATK
jgi:hypothetical protein